MRSQNAREVYRGGQIKKNTDGIVYKETRANLKNDQYIPAAFVENKCAGTF
jgi:hypothetical protein